MKFNFKKDTVKLGNKNVEIPKLTIAKWKLLFDNIQALPQIILNILAVKDTKDFSSTLIVGTGMAIDEIVGMVAVITGLDVEYIEENADINELSTFIYKTIKKNDLQESVKNFRAVLGSMKQEKQETEGGKSHLMNGSTTVQ
ncbi:hypothetical protein [Chengkuizengella axinellae]|uniref:Uncharacterized protein n=1 Tax=Chengkuizengella axinellae TaxID=3064388 RepID=A0ABT9IYC7_9BACL|nr:hypothetical protein [Chengkuizengella sp. 2205SS18-9]MDP5274354.1 hypothetical protein [Chengkuizengella sp. 2205SS18-9]